MSDAVLIGETLVGFSQRRSGQFFGLDARSGKTLWTSEPRQATNAAIVAAGDFWFALKDDGELLVAAARRARVRAAEAVYRGEQRDVGSARHLGQSCVREGCVHAGVVDVLKIVVSRTVSHCRPPAQSARSLVADCLKPAGRKPITRAGETAAALGSARGSAAAPGRSRNPFKSSSNTLRLNALRGDQATIWWKARRPSTTVNKYPDSCHVMDAFNIELDGVETADCATLRAANVQLTHV